MVENTVVISSMSCVKVPRPNCLHIFSHDQDSKPTLKANVVVGYFGDVSHNHKVHKVDNKSHQFEYAV